MISPNKSVQVTARVEPIWKIVVNFYFGPWNPLLYLTSSVS